MPFESPLPYDLAVARCRVLTQHAPEEEYGILNEATGVVMPYRPLLAG